MSQLKGVRANQAVGTRKLETEDRQTGRDTWHPQWTVDVGQGCEVGITIDDGCFVVLCANEVGQWRPATHIPAAAARLLGALADAN